MTIYVTNHDTNYKSNNLTIEFVRQNVRTLARKKFMVRALMNKVKEQTNKCEIK